MKVDKFKIKKIDNKIDQICAKIEWTVVKRSDGEDYDWVLYEQPQTAPLFCVYWRLEYATMEYKGYVEDAWNVLGYSYHIYPATLDEIIDALDKLEKLEKKNLAISI